MQDYNEFPPIKALTRVLKNCPKSSLVYVQLWDKRGKHLGFTVKKKDVRKEFLISPTVFRNLLAPLMFLNLIDFAESDDEFQIDIMGPQSSD